MREINALVLIVQGTCYLGIKTSCVRDGAVTRQLSLSPSPLALILFSLLQKKQKLNSLVTCFRQIKLQALKLSRN